MTLTTHGVDFVLRSSGVEKVAALLVLLTSATFGLYQVGNTFRNYLLFETRTTLTLSPITEYHLPSITFCPMSFFMKGIVGRSLGTIAWGYSLVGGFGNLTNSAMIGGQMCSDPNALLESVNMTYKPDLHRVFYDSFRTVKRCLFNGKQLNCDQLFFNHGTEMGMCFTFNPSTANLDVYVENNTNGGMTKTLGYGTHLDLSDTFPVRSGMRNSLTFIMNINMSQYCVPVAANMAGMMALVHNKADEPFPSSKPAVMLSPGFATNVAIRVKETRRYTESIGKCTSQLHLIYNPNNTAYTIRDAYLVDCLTDVVVRKCGCLPYFASFAAWQVKLWDESFCGSLPETISTRGPCMDNAIKEEYLIKRSCYMHIPTPCRETSIAGFPVSIKFPSPNLLPSLKRDLGLDSNMSLNEFRQNILSANFYMKDNYKILIREYPKMTWIDLLNQSGGTLGMCLGMSLLSIVEIVTLGVPLTQKLLLAYGGSDMTTNNPPPLYFTP